MAKKKAKEENTDLERLSNKYIPDNQLQDTVAILFRKILKAYNVNVSKWTALVNNHLKWEVTEKDPKRAKVIRTNHIGNIKSTFFESPTLTFPKLLAGLSILRFKEYEIILRVKDHEGKVYEVSERSGIASSFNKAELEQPPTENKTDK